MGIVVGAGVLVATTGAHANLIDLGAFTQAGSGLGNVTSVLRLSSPGSTSTESGSVGVDSAGMMVANGDVQNVPSATVVRSLSEVGLTNASDLRLVFDALEPGGNSITIGSLQLNIFSPTGATLFSANLAPTPFTLSSTTPGQGISDRVFGLDATQAASAQAAAFGTNSGANLIGLSAALSDATGGPDDFFLARATGGGGGPPTSVPEPNILFLAGTVVMGLAVMLRRRKLG